MRNPAPNPWPELPVPATVSEAALACLSDHGSRTIWAEGSETGRIMIVLDNPGAREDRNGIPFVCGTRRTLRSALMEAGLNDQEVYVTYLLKRRPRRSYDRQQAWKAYLPLLLQQIRDQSPHHLIFMGNTVVQALIGPEYDVKSLRERSLSYHDIPTIVTYHPLAARRRPQLYPLVVRDLSKATG